MAFGKQGAGFGSQGATHLGGSSGGGGGPPAAQGWGTVNRDVGVGTLNTAGDASFETWKGSAVSWVLAYANGSNWTNLQSFAVTEAGRGATHKIIWGIYIPADKTIANVNAGTEDAQYQALADTILAARPSQATIPIRIFPEFQNLATIAYAPGNETNWIAAYRRVALIFLNKSLKFRLVWNPNYTTSISGTPYDPSLAYPGDTYVDVIAQDVYKITSFDGDGAAAWNIRLTETYGLNWLSAFGTTHSKPIAIGEWGVDTNNDGPYVTLMAAWIAANNVAFQSYFDVNNGAFFPNKLSADQWPSSGSAYVNAFGVPTTGLLAANRFQVPTASVTITNNFTSRRTHYAHPKGDISSLKTVDFGYYLNDSFVMGATGITYTIKRYIEYPAGTFTQVLWSGATTKTITFASAVFVSDTVNVTIPAGAKFWERTVHVTGSSKDLPCVETPAASTTLGIDDGNDATDKGNSGTITASAGVNTFGANAIIGTVARGNARSFLAFGDSITWGFGDITSVGTKGGSGWLSRGLDPIYPWFKVAKNNIRADQISTLSASLTNLLAAIGFTDTIVAAGTNDLSQGIGTSSGIPTTIGTIFTNWAGSTRRWLTAIMSRSTSTDLYATVVNQTVKTDGNWSQAITLNANLRALPLSAVGILEVADASMSAHDSGKWAAPPAPTTDGTHPNSTSAASIASVVAGTVG